ncbi:unnamed protein product [Meloidogyne enterolobii]|uniref:Uncharacterized protein n=1 Tax=Meloidogyne enterolobii TaxID=390850 RepID=A0ACB1AB38_MELEN
MNSREQAKALGLEEHITCSLCQDYLSDAVTLTGCLHFFCRSCLLQHLSSAGPDSRKCPKCKIELGNEHIYKRDLRLQELVYKLVPDLFWRQLRRVARRQHRSSRDSNNGSSTTTALPSERRIQQRRMLLQLSTQLCSPNENISLQIEYVPLTKVLAASGDDSLVSLSGKIAATENHKEGENEDNQQILGEEQIILIDQQQQIPSSSSSSLPPQNICERTTATTAIERQQKQYSFCRYFRCSAKVKIEQLKRLLESKLAMSNFYGVYFVDPKLKFVLEDDFSLEDVVQLFSWSRKSPLQLNFTLAQLPPKEDENRQPAYEDMPQLDLESGPMELPQQQVSPIIITTTIKCQNNLNEIPKQGQEKIEKEEKLIKEKSVGINEGKNNIGGEGDGAVQKTASLSLLSPPSVCITSSQSSSISASSLHQSSSQHQQQQNQTTTKINLSKNIIRSSTQSPPNSTKTTIARLSTAGVSPLRPVTSLISPPPTNNGTLTNNVKKRQRNLSSSSPNIRPKKVQKQQEKSIKIDGGTNNNCEQTTITNPTNEIRANLTAGGGGGQQQKSPAGEGKSPRILIETQSVQQQIPPVVNLPSATSKAETTTAITISSNTKTNNKNISENKTTKTRTYNRSKSSKKQQEQQQQVQAVSATQQPQPPSQQFPVQHQQQIFSNNNNHLNNLGTFQNQFEAFVAANTTHQQQQQQYAQISYMQNMFQQFQQYQQQQNRQRNQQQIPQQTFEQQQQFTLFAQQQQQQQLSPQQIRVMQQMLCAMGMIASVGGSGGSGIPPFSSEQQQQLSLLPPSQQQQNLFSTITNHQQLNGNTPTKNKKATTTTISPSKQKFNSSNGTKQQHQQIVPLNNILPPQQSTTTTIFGENNCSNQLTNNNIKKVSTISS